jgi:hypothetical protein
MCENCVVQYNEGYATDSPGVDGGVFDIDYGNINNVVRYNYGHDSQGYCFSVFGSAGPVGNSINSAVHHNVCVNNGRSPRLAQRQGAVYLSTWEKGYLDGVEIYSNTIYWNPPTNVAAVFSDAEFTGTRPNLIHNNLFFSTVPAMINSKSGLRFDRNLYWYAGVGAPQWTYAGQTYSAFGDYQRASTQDSGGRYQDPRLDFDLRAQLSIVRNAKLTTTADCTRDAFGTKLNGDCGIGAIAPGHADALDEPASAFTLPNVRGGQTSFAGAQGKWTLLTFVDARASGSAGDDARTYAVWLQSALHQYSPKGLQALVAFQADGANSSDAVLNRAEAWHLQDATVLLDDGKVSRSYAVEDAPAMFLISPTGRIVRKWKGFVTPADLGLALRRVLGAPAGMANIDLNSSQTTNTGETAR